MYVSGRRSATLPGKLLMVIVNVLKVLAASNTLNLNSTMQLINAIAMWDGWTLLRSRRRLIDWPHHVVQIMIMMLVDPMNSSMEVARWRVPLAATPTLYRESATNSRGVTNQVKRQRVLRVRGIEQRVLFLIVLSFVPRWHKTSSYL